MANNTQAISGIAGGLNGAIAGTTFGPVGTIIGGALGIGLGIAGSSSGKDTGAPVHMDEDRPVNIARVRNELNNFEGTIADPGQKQYLESWYNEQVLPALQQNAYIFDTSGPATSKYPKGNIDFNSLLPQVIQNYEDTKAATEAAAAEQAKKDSVFETLATNVGNLQNMFGVSNASNPAIVTTQSPINMNLILMGGALLVGIFLLTKKRG